MDTLALIFLTVSQGFNLPPGLLRAVCYVESGHSISAINLHDGGSPSLGTCQIKLASARLLGFAGSSEALRRPDINVYYAGLYLRRQLDRYDGDIRKAVSAYNAGTFRVNTAGQTKNRKYVSKVLVAWSEDR